MARAPPKDYHPGCKTDCTRCIFSPIIDSVDDGHRVHPECCNSTAWFGGIICCSTFGLLSLALYIDDPVACACCPGSGVDPDDYRDDDKDDY